MAFPQGIVFWATSNFDTVPSGYWPEVGSSADYPTTTTQGNTVGWEQIPGVVANRSKLADARLDGINGPRSGVSTPCAFRIDLPASGSYSVLAAFGDANYSEGPFTVQFKDTNTVLSTPVNNTSTSAAAHWIDASGVERTSVSDWVNNNAAVSLTFSTTIFRIAMASTAIGVISTVFIQAAGGGFTPKFRRTLSPVGTRVGSRQTMAA